MNRRTTRGSRHAALKAAAAVPFLTAMLPGVVWSQGGGNPAPAPTAPVQTPQPPPATGTGTGSPQPSAPTPPTPLPTSPPSSEPLGIKPSDVKPTTLFRDEATPGQPQTGDPEVIRTLDDALQTAFRRSPSILLAQERAFRTSKTVDQVLSVKRPQVSAGLTYSRLSGLGAAFGGAGGAGGGVFQNPFPVGLQVTPPGSIPVTLSGGLATGTGSAGAVPSGGAAQFGAAAAGGSFPAGGRAAGAPTADAPGTSRQAQQPGDGDDGGNNGGNNGGGGGGFSFGGGGAILNQASARISVSQNIDVTGVIRAIEQLGGLEEALTRLEMARLRQEVALNVRNAFYNLLRAQAFVRVNEAAVAQSEELLRVTQAQLAAGVAAQFDVLRARTQLENNRQALITSRSQIAIARNALANLIGLDPSTPVDPVAPAVPAAPTLDEAALLAQALSQRPEYLQADVNLLKAEKNIRVSKRGMEPSLTAAINGGYNFSQTTFGTEKATGTFTLALNVPLSDGGATKAAVEAARSDERGARIQKDQFVRGIKAEVQQAIIAVRDASERASVTGATVEQAREALRLANVRYQAGVGTQLEINDAQTTLTQAETNQVNAQYDYLGALARLSRAVGNPE